MSFIYLQLLPPLFFFTAFLNPRPSPHPYLALFYLIPLEPHASPLSQPSPPANLPSSDGNKSELYSWTAVHPSVQQSGTAQTMGFLS